MDEEYVIYCDDDEDEIDVLAFLIEELGPLEFDLDA